MKKLFYVAAREFASTVLTKGFIIGILIPPVIIGVMIVIMPRLMKEAPPKIEGDVAIIDPTGEISGGLRDFLRPEKIAGRREELRRKVDEATPEALRKVAGASPASQAAIKKSLDTALGEVPTIRVVALPSAVDVEKEKAPLLIVPEKGQTGNTGRLAVIVVHPDAVARKAGNTSFGSYDLYVRGKLDDRIEDEIRSGMRDTLIAARIRTSGLDRDLVTSISQVPRVRSVTVTAKGEQTTNRAMNMLLPMGFMVLLLISVLTSGQYLLTTTVEEKSNRVVEVLLSAVSPMELMMGKILGQMAAGFLILVLYAGLGIAALVSFAVMGLINTMLIVFLLIFYVLAYITIASMMAAIGSAVNEMREAQTLMTPVMLVIMIPWLLWMPITRDPNSTFAVITSFIPPLSNFVMLLRLTSTAPPPLWQAWISVGVGALGAWGAAWFAAKVFRIGLLMYGKPPTFGTLIRWARMA